MSKDVNIKDLFSYHFSCELPGSHEKIKFKPVNTGQLKKLLVYENEMRKTVIDELLDELISECVLNENFNINELYLLDRFHLMLNIRMKSKGEDYEFTYICPECGKETYTSIDLTELNVIPYDDKIDHFVKCNDNVSVYIDFLTRGEEKELNKEVTDTYGEITLNDDGEIENKILGFYALKYIEYSIKKIKLNDGEIIDLNKEQKEEIIDQLTEENLTSVREWFEENRFGTDFNTTLMCINGHKRNFEVQPDKIFF